MIIDLLLDFVEDHGALIWSVSSGAGALGGAYILATLRIRSETAGRLLVEKEKVRNEGQKDATAQETAERAAFRAGLMAEVAELRKAIRDCEDDRRRLHERLTSHNSELKMLQAECSIMKMQMKYLTDSSGRGSDAP